MKKFLVLVAVFALAFSMGPVSDAFAEATVYGKMHVSIDVIDGDGAAGTAYEDPLIYVASNSTRWGFKGSQRLDNGMDLIFKLESGMAADGEDVGNFSTRNRYLGLKGGFGTILAGVHDTPFKMTGRRIKLFPEHIGDSRTMISIGGGTSGNTWDQREQSSLMWMKKFGPIDVAVLYSADRNTADNIDNNDTDAISASVGFESGPLMVAGAFERQNNVGATPDAQGLRAVGSFKLGDALKLVALFQKTEDNGAVGADRDTIGFGASFKLGDILLKGHVYQADDLGAAANTGGKLIALGAETKMSKTTTAYLTFAQSDNDANTDAFSISAGGAGHGDPLTSGQLVNGDSPSGVSVGIIYDF